MSGKTCNMQVIFQNKLHITNCCLFYDFYHNAHPQRPANAFTLSKSKDRVLVHQSGAKSIVLGNNTTVMLQPGHTDMKFELLSITSRHNNRLHSFTTVLETEVTLFSVY